MTIIFDDCPACGAKDMEFDINNVNDCSFPRHYDSPETFDAFASGQKGRCRRYDLLSVCPKCHNEIAFVISEPYDWETDERTERDHPMKQIGLIEYNFQIEGIVRVCDNVAILPPDFIPQNIKAVFEEAIRCLSMQCWNAAGAMFRLCLDLTTKDMIQELPENSKEGLTEHHRKILKPRLDWLFENKKLPEDLKDLVECIKDDGNVGVHDARLTRDDSFEILNFTVMLLEHIYTAPAKRKRAKEKRDQRKAKHAKS